MRKKCIAVLLMLALITAEPLLLKRVVYVGPTEGPSFLLSFFAQGTSIVIVDRDLRLLRSSSLSRYSPKPLCLAFNPQNLTICLPASLVHPVLDNLSTDIQVPPPEGGKPPPMLRQESSYICLVSSPDIYRLQCCVHVSQSLFPAAGLFVWFPLHRIL